MLYSFTFRNEIQYGRVKLYSYPVTSLKHEQERYRNLSFQKTEESVLKHHLLSPSIYKIMQRRHSYSFAFALSIKHEQEQY